MSITSGDQLKPVIVVCGIGRAGCNAVNNMIKSELEGAKFLVANTDAQTLQHSLAPVKLEQHPHRHGVKKKELLSGIHGR